MHLREALGHGWTPYATRAFQHRNFRLFYGGQSLSLIGTWCQITALGWQVYALTGSAGLLGAITFCTQIPVLVLTPLGGALADRMSLRPLLLVTQTLQGLLAIVLGVLVGEGQAGLVHVFVIATLQGCAAAVDLPARQALIARLVPATELSCAITLNSAMFSGSRLIGPWLAGLLIGATGSAFCFLVNGLSFGAFVVGLMLMRLDEPAIVVRGSLWTTLLEGLRFVAGEPLYRWLLTVLGICGMAASTNALMPVFATQVLHGGPQTLGWLMGAAGAGAFAGGVALAARRTDVSVFKLALAAVGVGLGLLGLGGTANIGVDLAAMALLGGALEVQLVLTNVLLQSTVPEAFRSRVTAVMGVMFQGLAPLGALLAGFGASHLGAPRVALVAGAIASLAGLALGAWGWRRRGAPG